MGLERAKLIAERRLALGIPKGEPLPRCPWKSKSRANLANDNQVRAYAAEHPDERWLFDENGALRHWYELKSKIKTHIPSYVDHRARKHKPCDECRCLLDAGSGTDHPGSGLCHYHEKEVSAEEAYAVSQKHEQALIRHNPFTYDHASVYIDAVRKRAADAPAGIHMRDDLNVLRGFVSEVLAKAHPEEDPKIIRELRRIANQLEMIKLDGEMEELAGLIEAIGSTIEAIRERWSQGITESSRNGPVTASDITRMKAVSDIIKTMEKVMGSQWKFDSKNYISQDKFNVWLAQIMDTIKVMAPSEKWFNELVVRLLEIKEPEAGT